MSQPAPSPWESQALAFGNGPPWHRVVPAASEHTPESSDRWRKREAPHCVVRDAVRGSQCAVRFAVRNSASAWDLIRCRPQLSLRSAAPGRLPDLAITAGRGASVPTIGVTYRPIIQKNTRAMNVPAIERRM
jgi:hypothetical protein